MSAFPTKAKIKPGCHISSLMHLTGPRGNLSLSGGSFLSAAVVMSVKGDVVDMLK